MRNIKLTIEYDGKDFNGWQMQTTFLNADIIFAYSDF